MRSAASEECSTMYTMWLAKSDGGINTTVEASWFWLTRGAFFRRRPLLDLASCSLNCRTCEKVWLCFVQMPSEVIMVLAR